MKNLSTNVLKQLSINGKGYPYFKKACFIKLSFLLNFVQTEQTLKQR